MHGCWIGNEKGLACACCGVAFYDMGCPRPSSHGRLLIEVEMTRDPPFPPANDSASSCLSIPRDRSKTGVCNPGRWSVPGATQAGTTGGVLRSVRVDDWHRVPRSDCRNPGLGAAARNHCDGTAAARVAWLVGACRTHTQTPGADGGHRRQRPGLFGCGIGPVLVLPKSRRGVLAAGS